MKIFKTEIEIIESAWRDILSTIKKNWNKDQNFKDTPNRIARAIMNEKCSGIGRYDECKRVLIESTFQSVYDGMVIIGPIHTNSICPHHFENITYNIMFGYIPRGKVVGLSKPGRVIDILAKQPILQEDYTKMLADLFMECIEPEGIGLVVKGVHMCMSSRGGLQQNSSTVTSEVRGWFRDKAYIKDEFLKLCGY